MALESSRYKTIPQNKSDEAKCNAYLGGISNKDCFCCVKKCVNYLFIKEAMKKKPTFKPIYLESD